MFKDVLQAAQITLRTSFGMELVELQSRAQEDEGEGTNKENEKEKSKANGKDKVPKPEKGQAAVEGTGLKKRGAMLL